VRKIPFDAQRDMPFYRTVVGFRNAVERMRSNRGDLPDSDHLFWGFGGYGGGPAGDDDGLAGSRIPRRPYGGSGAATIGLEPPEQLDWEEPVQTETSI
jgi:hypothetical protein